MILSQVYDKYTIPPNLQRHLFRVAALGLQIASVIECEISIDRDVIIQTLTLHDIGKIVNFDFVHAQYLLEEEAANIEYWIKAQKDFINKFGNNEHQALIKIAQQIGVSRPTLLLLEKFGSTSVEYKVNSDDWHLKICTYADFRTGPFGIISVKERFDELAARYERSGHTLLEINELEKDRHQCLELERELQKFVNVPLSTITDESILPFMKDLPNYRF